MRSGFLQRFGALMLTVLLIASATAEEPQGDKPKPKPRNYQPAGAVADPQVPARWNRYHDYQQATDLMKELAAAYPDTCRMRSLGKSHEGREMWLLTITNFKHGEELEKPAFWIDGGIHANELQSVDVVLYTAWYLTEMNGRSEVITELLNERVFYMVPMMSPDSRDAHMYSPNTTHSPRSGQRPVDDDRDGLVDEDGPDDLDGDGHITEMRVKDVNGSHKPHPDYPQLMIPVKPGEQGEYRMLGQEGFDNDGDGRVNEDSDGYYDPNRDWAWNWQPKAVQRGASEYPFAVSENRLVADFIMTRPNIAGAQSYHNSGGMLLRGPGAKNDRVEPADVKVYDYLGKQGEMLLPGYRYIVTGFDLYECYGAELDWFYAAQGVFTFTNELNTPFNMFRDTNSGGFFGTPEASHKFNRYLLFNDGLSEWREIEHPQYGKIEVGGLKKNWLRQPPSFLLEEECHRNMAFTLLHADEMPRVRVQSVTTKQLAAGLTEVTAVIINEKRIPTHSAHDVKHKITPPDRIAIQGAKLEVLTALTADDPAFIDPQEHKRQPESLRLATIRQGEPVYVRWIVRGAAPFEVSVESIKGGRDVRSSDKERP